MCNLCTGTKEPSCKLPMTTLYQLEVSLPEKSLHDSSNIKQKRCKFCNNVSFNLCCANSSKISVGVCQILQM
uniref:Uncharacterized protein n=1 Tax=Solanum tuberosum TaxID=4113 RepID=M1BRA3_SOLTU